MLQFSISQSVWCGGVTTDRNELTYMSFSLCTATSTPTLKKATATSTRGQPTLHCRSSQAKKKKLHQNGPLRRLACFPTFPKPPPGPSTGWGARSPWATQRQSVRWCRHAGRAWNLHVLFCLARFCHGPSLPGGTLLRIEGNPSSCYGIETAQSGRWRAPLQPAAADVWCFGPLAWEQIRGVWCRLVQRPSVSANWI